jgi:PAS domain S-box-containing protein
MSSPRAYASVSGSFSPSTGLRTAYWLLGALAALGAGAIVVGMVLAPRLESGAAAAWQSRLETMSLDRARLVETWLEEGLAEAALIGRYPTVHWEFGRRPGTSPPFPAELGASGHLAELLTASTQVRHLESAWVIGADGGSVSSAGAANGALAQQVARRALEEGRPFADFVGEPGQQPVVAFASPLASQLAVVVLLVSPDRWLHPLLEAEPLDTVTGECLLLRSRAGSVEVLSPRRHQPGPGALGTTPLTTPGGGAFAAASGLQGFGEFVDDRGQSVYASVRRLSQADWDLVVKVDRDEALRPARRQIRDQLLLVELSLLVLLAFAYAAARRQGSRYALSLAQRDAQLAALLEHANDAILLVDRAGRIRGAHGAAQWLYGRPAAELTGLGMDALLSPGAVAGEAATNVATAFQAGHLVYETEHVSAEGEPVPVEVSARTVRLGDEELLVAIVRDVRLQRAEERRVRALNGVLRTLTEVNHLVQHERDLRQLLPAVCRVAVRDGAFATAWIGLLEGEARLAPFGAAGAGAEALSALVGELGEGALWWRAIRGDRICSWSSEASDPGPECADWMRETGLTTAVAAPLRRNGRPSGVIVLYARSGELGAELRPLVGELAVDLSLALTTAEAERHRDDAREALRATEKRFRRLADGARDVIYRYQVDPPRIEYVSPSIATLTGYEPAAFYADPGLVLGCTHPADRPRLEPFLRGEGEYDAPVVVRLEHRDGGTRWTEHRVVPTRESGRIVALDGIARDVTERVEAEEELRRSRERYRMALLRSPVVVFEQDRELRYTWAHDPESRLIGEAAGRSDAELLPEVDAAVLTGLKRAVLESGQGVHEVFETEAGATFDLTLEPLMGRTGSVTGVIGTAVDVTASREREVRLRQLSRAIEQSPSSVIITDIRGNIEYVNSTFSSVTGYAADEVLGREVRLLKSGEHPSETFADLWHTITSGREWRGELCNRRKSGELYWESVSIAPLADEAGRITHFVSVQSDLTARREAERELEEARLQLVQSQKLEAVGQLAGGVAHDFNNLLNVIMGFTELLGRGLGDDARAQQRVGQIMGAARRAGDLTRQLLAFSRRQVLQPRVVDLDEIVTTFEKMIRRLIGEDVELSFEGSSDQARVKVDPGQMEQVLMNLCVNARDAMPRGGLLSIRTGVVSLDRAYAASRGPVQPGDYVLVTVSDTGCGMDSATQARIFEPFFTTKEAGSGTGLGLATVYGIVKQSGGYVWVYSEVGVGTTFKIYLPVAEGEAAARVVDDAAPVRAAGPHVSVLLVEDQDALREMIHEVLDDLGYTVVEAADGPRALELAAGRDAPVDLLLTDLVMPRMSGRELAEQLRQRWPGLRVLYMSGYTADVVARHGILEPGVQLLHKPFSTTELANRLREALNAPPRL